MHTVLYLTFIRGKHHKLAFTLKPVIIRRDRSDPRLKRHTGHSRREGVMFSLFIDWRSWWGPIMHFGRRAGKCTEVAPTRVRGGDDVAALHRYSMRGFTLSCTVKVCVPLWGGRDRVMDDTRLYARRDSTAGLLNDRGAWPSTHLPILGRAGDLMGRKKSRCHVQWTDVLERRQQRQRYYRDLSVSLPSLVIENHVKGQFCDTACPSLQVIPLSQNMTKTTLTRWQLSPQLPPMLATSM